MKVLVLCVDRDDDLGKKTKLRGPVIGKEDNLKAAEAILLADPEESDGNAIYAALKLLKDEKEAVDIVTITGNKDRGYNSDKMIRKQLTDVMKKYPEVDGVYLVTDGADDDQVIPIINSITKMISKKTIIIKQSAQLEKSYYVVKEVLKDPAFARVIFGLPAIVLLVWALFQNLGLQIIMFSIGAYLLIKGFGLEDPIINAIRGFRESTSIDRPSFPLYVVAFLLFLMAAWAGFDTYLKTQASLAILAQAATFLNGMLSLVWVGLLFFLIGRALDMYYLKEPLKTKKHISYIMTGSALLYVISQADALILGSILLDELIANVVIVFLATIIVLAGIRKFYLNKYIMPKLKKDLQVLDADGNIVGVVTEVNKKYDALKITTKSKEKKVVPLTKVITARDDYVAIRV